jgi:hypothetical protein
LSTDDEQTFYLDGELQRKVSDTIREAWGKTGITPCQDLDPLPQSILDQTEASVDLSTLFIDPSAGPEPACLAFDNHGNHKTLSRGQILSVRREGTIEIPSIEYPGQVHIWMINNLIQRGSSRINATFHNDMNGAMSHIAASWLAISRAKGLSIRKGGSEMLEGMLCPVPLQQICSLL